MSLSEEILIILGGYASGYKHMRKAMHGMYPERSRSLVRALDANPNALRVALSRLKKRGQVKNRNQTWSVTLEGKRYLDKILKPNAAVLKNNTETFDMVVAFDIPEAKRKKRDWLREQLVSAGFRQMQRSLWRGRAPLPESFIKDLHGLKLLRCVKFFKATEDDIV